MDIGQLVKLKSDLEGHYSRMHANMKQCADYYNQEYEVKHWKEFDPYKPAKGRNKVDVGTDHVMSIGIKVHVLPWSNAEKAKATAGRLERWGTAEIGRVQKPSGMNESPTDPLRGVIKNMLAYGMGCLKGPLFVPREWPDKPSVLGKEGDERKRLEDEYEEKRGTVYPFYTRSVHPLNLFIDPAMDCPSFVIEKFRRKAMTIKRLYPDVKLAVQDNADVDWWEYWSATEYAYMIGSGRAGDSVKPRPITDGIEGNPLGLMPYHIGYSGMGEEAPDGAPEYRCIGLLYPILTGLKAEAKAKTALLTLLEWAAYGKPAVDRMPENMALSLGAPGEISIIPPDLNYREIPPVSVNQDVYRILGMIDEDNDEATLMPVLEGTEPRSSTVSGYLRGLSIGQARIRLEGVVSSLERIGSCYLSSFGKLIRDVVKDKVTINGFINNNFESETVGPDDFRANPQFRVRLDGKTPEEIDRRIRLGLELWTTKALSWETICRDYFGIDPVAERENKLLEEVMSSPEIKAAMAQAAIEAQGMDKYIRQIKETQKQEAGLGPDRNRSMQRLEQLSVPRGLGSPAEMMV